MDDRVLRVGRVVVRIANALNWLGLAGFAVAIVASFPAAGWVLGLLATKYPAIDGGPVLIMMRFGLLIGIGVGLAAHVVFSRLIGMIDTVRGGDPFVAANALRLQAIGWAMLAIQLLDLAVGAGTAWMVTHHIDVLDWTPSLGGWLATLMIFVLARVFAIGTRMRDDLAMTI